MLFIIGFCFAFLPFLNIFNIKKVYADSFSESVYYYTMDEWEMYDSIGTFNLDFYGNAEFFDFSTGSNSTLSLTFSLSYYDDTIGDLALLPCVAFYNFNFYYNPANSQGDACFLVSNSGQVSYTLGNCSISSSIPIISTIDLSNYHNIDLEALTSVYLYVSSISLNWSVGDSEYHVYKDYSISSGVTLGECVISGSNTSIYQEGYNTGYNAGHTAGYTDGYNAGLVAGAGSNVIYQSAFDYLDNFVVDTPTSPDYILSCNWGVLGSISKNDYDYINSTLDFLSFDSYAIYSYASVGSLNPDPYLDTMFISSNMFTKYTGENFYDMQFAQFSTYAVDNTYYLYISLPKYFVFYSNEYLTGSTNEFALVVDSVSSISSWSFIRSTRFDFTGLEATYSYVEYSVDDYVDILSNVYNDGLDNGFTAGNTQTDDYNYQLGYVAGKNYGFNQGYTAGYNAGKNDGYDLGVVESNNYSFLGLIGAVIDAPIKAFTGLFNFEFLGINLLSFFTSILTLSILVVIIRFCLGGK